MATRKPSKKVAKPAARKRPPPRPRPLPCSRTIEFFRSVTVGPGESYDTGTAVNVDCYQWLHVWVLSQHPGAYDLDNVSVELVFELPGKMGGGALADLSLPYSAGVVPTQQLVSTGSPGFLWGFVIRAPIIGPTVRPIVVNNGPHTYDFSLWGYLTH